MGKMRQFRRALRSCANRAMTMQIHDGFGATMMETLIQVILAKGAKDSDIFEVFDMAPNEGEHAGHMAAPTIIPGGRGGKATAMISMRGIALYDLEFQPFAFSTLLLGQTVKTLANDPEIGTIILDIDSPGGVVTGVMEAADAIFAARSTGTNIVAMVSPLAASAAYWLASQANEIIAVPSADVGSIGVFMLHVDQSKMLDDIGVKPTFISAGEFKVEGNGFEPLTDEAREHFQSEVDATHKDFIKAVARGRGVSVSTVANEFGRGRTISAPDARKSGMIDRIATRDVALARAGVNGQNLDGRRRVENEAAQTQPKPLVIGRVRNTSQENQSQDGGFLIDSEYSRAVLGLMHGTVEWDDLSEDMQKQITEARELDPDDAVSIDDEQSDPEAAEVIEGVDLRVDYCDGGQIVYAATRWPERTAISDSLFDLKSLLSVDGETVTITVANGSAIYRKVSDWNGADGWIVELLESTWEAPPEAPEPVITIRNIGELKIGDDVALDYESVRVTYRVVSEDGQGNHVCHLIGHEPEELDEPEIEEQPRQASRRRRLDVLRA